METARNIRGKVITRINEVWKNENTDPSILRKWEN